MRFTGETSYHKLDAFLELTVLGGVNDRIDTAVAEYQNAVEVVKPKEQKLRMYLELNKVLITMISTGRSREKLKKSVRK